MATKLKNLRISKVDFVDEGANPDAHIKLTKSKGEKGQSTGENGDKNGFVSRLFGFIGKKAGMNQEEIDSAVEEVLKGNSVSFNERFNEIKNRKITQNGNNFISETEIDETIFEDNCSPMTVESSGGNVRSMRLLNSMALRIRTLLSQETPSE